MKTSKISSLAAILAVVIALAGSRPSSAQPMDLDTPVDSPLWWTLTDEITPGQLRATYRDPMAQVDRYQAAMKAGLAAQNFNEEQLKSVKFYYNTRLDPELTPMWLAFEAFAGAHLHFRGAAHATDALTNFGFGRTAVTTILLFGTREFDESQAIVQEVGPASLEFQEMERKAIRGRGGDRVAVKTIERAAKEGDLDMLQQSTGVSRDHLAELRAAWMRNPVTETAAKLLPELREQLNGDDWQRLRRFLLEHVVADMGNELLDIDPGQEVTP